MKRRQAMPDHMGEIVDESIPDISFMTGHEGIDVGDFGTWLGPVLGTYRVMSATGPSSIEQRQSLERLECALRELATSIDAPLPAIPHAYLDLISYRHTGKMWLEISRYIVNEARRASGLAMAALNDLEGTPTHGGRPDKGRRNQLLATIVGKLESYGPPTLSFNVACELAAAVLQSAGIDVPEDLHKVKAIVHQERSTSGKGIDRRPRRSDPS